MIGNTMRMNKLKRKSSRANYSSYTFKSIVIMNNLVLHEKEQEVKKIIYPSINKGVEFFMVKKNYIKVRLETKLFERVKDILLSITRCVNMQPGWEGVKLDRVISISTNPIRNITEFLDCEYLIACSSIPKPKILKYVQSIWHLIQVIEMGYDPPPPPQLDNYPSNTSTTMGPNSSLDDSFGSMKLTSNSSMSSNEGYEHFESIENFTWKRKYEIGERIGEGSYSKIYKCNRINCSSKIYAIKIIPVDSAKSRVASVYNEFKILEKCQLLKENYERIYLCKFSLQLPILMAYEINKDQDFGCGFLMEYASYGDLQDLLYQKNTLTEFQGRALMFQLLHALNFLHIELKIIHRDIKCENILITEITENKISIKLGDFGLATILEENVINEVCGTPYYMAPEMLEGISYDFSVDIWAAAVVLFYILIGRQPFIQLPVSPCKLKDGEEYDEMEEVFRHILDYEVNLSPIESKKISVDCRDYILSILESSADERMNSTQCLESKWMTN